MASIDREEREGKERGREREREENNLKEKKTLRKSEAQLGHY